MSVQTFEQARGAVIQGNIISSNTWKMIPLMLGTASNLVKAITGATNASPIVLTVGSTTGWNVGDLVVVRGVGGNTAANGTFRISALSGTTITLQTVAPPGGTQINTTGNAAYTSGGTIINLSIVAVLSDISAGRVTGLAADPTLSLSVAGTGKVSATSPVSFTGVNASTTFDAFVTYQTTGTHQLIFFDDGKQLVRADANAATSATSITVEPLQFAIANGTAVVFTNGVTATLTAQANAGDRTLTVSALSAGINAGHHGDFPILNSNLPGTTGTPGSQTIQYNVDSTFGLGKF